MMPETGRLLSIPSGQLDETCGMPQNEALSKYVYNPAEGAFWSSAGDAL